MLFTLMLACKPEATTPMNVDTEIPTPTASEFREIGVLSVGAQFGYDAVSGTAQPTSLDGDLITPTFDIQLGPPGWNGSITAREHCTVSYDLTNLPVDSSDHTALQITVPADTPTTTDCEDLDPARWGEDPSEAFRPAELGVTIEMLADDVRQWLVDQDADVANFTGATFQTADVFGEDDTFAYTNVFETSDSLEITINDQDRLVELASVDVLAAPPTAWYSANSGVLWTIQ